MNKLPLAVQFIINCFLVVVLVNAVVSAAHIIKDKDFSFFESVQVFLFTLITSALFFAAICLLLYLLGVISGMGREKTFWLLMVVGITITIGAYEMFKEFFYKYAEPGYIAGIGAFSIMVSLASQYQLFHRIELDNKEAELSKQ